MYAEHNAICKRCLGQTDHQSQKLLQIGETRVGQPNRRVCFGGCFKHCRRISQSSTAQ